ncbi:hypothetical protein [Ammoniphilus sp. YIM 78166]|uniref:hypothetical protein n=1 Tax=Ammoniphilus sp. YIM 78166 TaxID=1644106 RepID=UPI00106F8087|nr:hypothetical protein [Ammoniphilus sp. YIM 78166]
MEKIARLLQSDLTNLQNAVKTNHLDERIIVWFGHFVESSKEIYNGKLATSREDTSKYSYKKTMREIMKHHHTLPSPTNFLITEMCDLRNDLVHELIDFDHNFSELKNRLAGYLPHLETYCKQVVKLVSPPTTTTTVGTVKMITMKPEDKNDK